MIEEKVKKFRKDHNLSQEELANLLGVSRESICNWETGKCKMSPLAIFLFTTLQDKISNNLRGKNENKRNNN